MPAPEKASLNPAPDGPWTILRVLDASREFFEKRGVDSPRLDAEILMAHALQIPRVMLYARHDQPLADAELSAIRALVARRGKREPVAQILGLREFWSLSFEVSRDVLTPRPDSETLIEVALERARRMDKRALKIADVGTGSGCLAIALAKELPEAELFALDASPAALALATRNIARHQLGDRVHAMESDLLSAAPAELDLIVANLPYIPSATIAGLMPEVRDFEPQLALDGGPDGLALIRRLIDQTPAKLLHGGAIALEAGFDQLDRVSALLTGAGFTDLAVVKDFGGNPRVASALHQASSAR